MRVGFKSTDADGAVLALSVSEAGDVLVRTYDTHTDDMGPIVKLDTAEALYMISVITEGLSNKS